MYCRFGRISIFLIETSEYSFSLIIKEILCNFQVEATTFRKKNSFFFDHKNMKKQPQKLLIIGSNLFFQYCQPAQNQPKSLILFYKNGSLCDCCIMTLPAAIGHGNAINSLKNSSIVRLPSLLTSIVEKFCEVNKLFTIS